MRLLCGIETVGLLADAGIPMIFITMPAMLIALVPIVAIEYLVIRRRIALRPWPLVKAIAKANVVSTLVGIPLTWAALFLCELALLYGSSAIPAVRDGSWSSPLAQIAGTILTAPWIAPEGTQPWMISLAALVLLIPFFFVSVWSERLVLERAIPITTSDAPTGGEVNKGILRTAVRDANLASYAALGLLACVWLVWGVFPPRFNCRNIPYHH